MLEERQLFGGAIVMKLPANAFDISKVREVPDHEEVFTHPQNDQSIMIEILEHHEIDDESAPEYYFKDLAEANKCENDCTINEIVKIENTNFPNCDSAWYLSGMQSISKYNETAKNTVNLNLVLLRYKQFESDILITFNDPLIINPASSSHTPTAVHSDRWSKESFEEMISSFAVLDFNLFG